MRYIVVGGSGFVGSYTIVALQEAISKNRIEDGEIICADRIHNPTLDHISTFVACDLMQGFSLPLHPDDVLIHLAARAYAPKPPLKPFGLQALREYFYSVNVDGTRAVLEAMLESSANKLIYFSTDMVYGKPQYLPVDTKHTRAPFGYYGASKAAAEDLITSPRYSHIHTCIFRPRIIVGAGRYGILTKLFALISASLPVPLIGNGENCYQMISVQDCAQAILCAIESNFPTNAYNLGSHNPPTIKSLLRNLITQAGSKSILIPTHAKSVKLALSMLENLGLPLMYKEQYAIADEQYIVDISSTQNDLGWNPLHSDSDMLLDAYNQYLKR